MLLAWDTLIAPQVDGENNDDPLELTLLWLAIEAGECEAADSIAKPRWCWAFCSGENTPSDPSDEEDAVLSVEARP